MTAGYSVQVKFGSVVSLQTSLTEPPFPRIVSERGCFETVSVSIYSEAECHGSLLVNTEEEPTNLTVPETVLRSCIFLAAMTESEDLPADPDYRIQVR